MVFFQIENNFNFALSKFIYRLQAGISDIILKKNFEH